MGRVTGLWAWTGSTAGGGPAGAPPGGAPRAAPAECCSRRRGQRRGPPPPPAAAAAPPPRCAPGCAPPGMHADIVSSSTTTRRTLQKLLCWRVFQALEHVARGTFLPQHDQQKGKCTFVEPNVLRDDACLVRCISRQATAASRCLLCGGGGGGGGAASDSTQRGRAATQAKAPECVGQGGAVADEVGG